MKWKALAIVLVFAVTAVVRLWWGHTEHVRDPIAANGVIDLREWDPESGKSIPLRGGWAFYPEQLIPPGGTFADTNKLLVQVPGGWDPIFSSAFGYGTYRLTILLPEAAFHGDSERRLAIRTTIIRSAHTLFIDGLEIGSNGSPGADASLSSSRVLPYVADFTASGDRVELVMQVSNFEYASFGGIFKDIKFGTYESLQRSSFIEFGEHAILMGIFLVCGLFFFILYGFRRNNYELLYFAGFFTMSLLHWMTHEERLLFWVFPDMSYRLQSTLQSLPSAIMFASLLGFVRWMFPSRARPWMMAYAACGAVLFSGVYVATDVSFFSRLEWPLMLFDLTMVILASYLLVSNFLQRAQDAIFSLIALCCIVFEGLFQGLFLIGFDTVEGFPPFEKVLFVLTMCYVIAKRFFTGMQEIETLSKQLIVANRLKNDFLAVASHEIRLPLHGMINLAQVMLNEGDLDERQSERLSMLTATGNQLTHLVSDMLDLTKLNEGSLEIEIRQVDIGTLMNGVADVVRSLKDSRSVWIENRIDPGMPPVLADDHRLMQVLFHLFHYALKWGARGKMEIGADMLDRNKRAAIRIVAGGERKATTEIEDQEPLFATDFGIYLSRRLLTLHGSSLFVEESESQVAMTFHLSIADQPKAVRNRSESPGKHASAITARQESAAGIERTERQEMLRHVKPNAARILIIDDDPVSLRIMFDILVQEKLDVTALTDGLQALRLIEQEGGWDLIVLDAMLSRMSGYDVCRKIRERYSFYDLPVLFLTSRSLPAFLLIGFNAGANDYVIKPFDTSELLARIRTLLHMKRSVRERLDIEMALIQAQIKPHFLYNTLNTIASLSEVDPDRTRDLLADFGSYLQSSFDLRNLDQEVPFEKEWTLVQSYLNIEKARFGSRIQITTDILCMADFDLPPLTIQPIVENAVRHGVLKKIEGGQIHIEVAEMDDCARISVRDTGEGIPPLKREAILDGTYRLGIGLVNVNRRLKNAYGQGLSIDSVEGTGTVISFLVPLKHSKEA